MCRALAAEHPQALFFTSRLVFRRDSLFTRPLHKQAALVILPMKR